MVFQELREARALAYSASAAYSQGSRENAQNLVLGVIGTQTDKTVDALSAFVDLIDNMPASSERFDETVNSLVNRYRTSKLSFREVIGAVRRWEELGLRATRGVSVLRSCKPPVLMTWSSSSASMCRASQS